MTNRRRIIPWLIVVEAVALVQLAIWTGESGFCNRIFCGKPTNDDGPTGMIPERQQQQQEQQQQYPNGYSRSNESSAERIRFRIPPKLRIRCNRINGDCLDPVGVIGRWVYTPNHTVLTRPGCCDPERREVTLDSFPNPIKCKKGESPYFFRGETNRYTQQGTYECKCPDFTDQYIWQAPDLLPFDVHRTCQLLGGSTVLLLGDSTMRQTASYLMNALFPGGCQTQIIFRQTDTLIDKEIGHLNRGGHWMSLVETTKPLADIVVLSVGPHIQQDLDNTTTIFRLVLDEVLDGIAKMKNSSTYRNITVVWKTQHPRGCSKSISPLNPAEAAQQTNLSGMRHTPKQVFYDWDLHLLSRLQELDMPYLDLRMLYSRSDAHPASRKSFFHKKSDCLHFCTGPLDIVASLFQKFLMTLTL